MSFLNQGTVTIKSEPALLRILQVWPLMLLERLETWWELAKTAPTRRRFCQKPSRRAACTLFLQELEDRLYLSAGPLTSLPLSVSQASATGILDHSASAPVQQGGQIPDLGAHHQGNQQTGAGLVQPARTYAPGADPTLNDDNPSIAQAVPSSGQDAGRGQETKDASPDDYPIPPAGAPARHEDNGDQPGSVSVLLPLKGDPLKQIPAELPVLARIEVPTNVANQSLGPKADRPGMDSLGAFLNGAAQAAVPARSITADEPQPAADHGPRAVTILLNLSADLGSAGNANAGPKGGITAGEHLVGPPEPKAPGPQVSALSASSDDFAAPGTSIDQERDDLSSAMVEGHESYSIQDAIARSTRGPTAPARAAQPTGWRLWGLSRSACNLGILLASCLAGFGGHSLRLMRGALREKVRREEFRCAESR